MLRGVGVVKVELELGPEEWAGLRVDLTGWTEEWVVLGVELEVGSDEWVEARGGFRGVVRGVGWARVVSEHLDCS